MHHPLSIENSLKGHSPMYRKTLLSALAMAFVALLAIQTQVLAGGANTSWQKVRADLTGNTAASGKAVYRERMRNGLVEQRFSVEVEDAAPGTIMQVNVNGILFGTFVVNDLGIGELEYRTPAFIDDPGDGDPIPDGFPTLVEGDAITVGILSGVFD
jgi:hypothetical protein